MKMKYKIYQQENKKLKIIVIMKVPMNLQIMKVQIKKKHKYHLQKMFYIM